MPGSKTLVSAIKWSFHHIPSSSCFPLLELAVHSHICLWQTGGCQADTLRFSNSSGKRMLLLYCSGTSPRASRHGSSIGHASINNQAVLKRTAMFPLTRSRSLSNKDPHPNHGGQSSEGSAGKSWGCVIKRMELGGWEPVCMATRPTLCFPHMMEEKMETNKDKMIYKDHR